MASVKNIFARWCCPIELITHNGPQFTGAVFVQFARAFDFRRPRFEQANREAERPVHSVKLILRQA